MTVRDLLPMDIDIDVIDDVVEDLYVAFCGPMKLTEEGLKEFGEVLDYPVKFNPSSPYGPIALIGCDDPE